MSQKCENCGAIEALEWTGEKEDTYRCLNCGRVVENGTVVSEGRKMGNVICPLCDAKIDHLSFEEEYTKSVVLFADRLEGDDEAAYRPRPSFFPPQFTCPACEQDIEFDSEWDAQEFLKGKPYKYDGDMMISIKEVIKN